MTRNSEAMQPPEMGEVVEFPEVGGLHHRYERRAASPPLHVQPGDSRRTLANLRGHQLVSLNTPD